MSANLNEFTGEQLTTAISLFRERMDELNSKIEILRTFEDGETKSELLQVCYGDFDTFQLWVVQMENAREEVVRRETVNLN